MSKKRTALIAGTAGLAVGLAFGGAQLASAGHANPVLSADLDGRQEVAGDDRSKGMVGDPNGRGEAYVFGIDGDPDRQTLCYVLVVDKVAETDLAPGDGRAAHIHEGAPGENGPVVANLAWPEDGQAADCLEADAERGGIAVFADGTSPADILANPGDYYVNVHNTEYPAGAIRGQLGGG
jgi:hypothetical protein